jgi:hypothetical protein
MTLTNELNRVRYVAEDFSTYRQEADSFFSTNYPEEFNNLINTDLGNALMDQLAFAMQALTFTLNRKASENFLQTARITKNIVKLARTLGYSIRPASPSVCQATLLFTGAPYSFPVIIPVGFKFQGPGDTIYEYRGLVDAILLPGQTTITITLKEGETRVVTFVSSGEANQQFSVFGIPENRYMYSDSLTLTVDGNNWERLDLLRYESSDTYEILFADVPPKLRFGDGIAGNIPPINSEIILTHTYGKGVLGAIGSNQILGPVVPLVANGQTIPFTITNTVASVGEDPETIEHVKAFASIFFRTQNAAVIKSDYDSIASLESGVALADAQIMRGVSGDITIMSEFAKLHSASDVYNSASVQLIGASVSGQSALGVDNILNLSVSGQSSLFVDGLGQLGVSGINFLGTDVSGNVTGISFLGVSGQTGLFIGGLGGLYVSGTNSLGVSGISMLGVTNKDQIDQKAVSGQALVDSAVSGLSSYLSRVFSDTSHANNVQVVVLSVDSSNKYISPDPSILLSVQTKLQQLADAVVTVTAVDGISRVIECDIEVDLGISQTAIRQQVEQQVLDSLVRSSGTKLGMLVRRRAGESLYKSDIQDRIRSETTEADIEYINIRITHPINLLDSSGNLIIKPQYVIQGRNITVRAVQRFLSNGQVVDILT